MALRVRSPHVQSERSEHNLATTRYALLPGWVFVPQLFLAFGWLRAGVSHKIRTEWRSGQDLRDFVAAQSGDAIVWYHLFLNHVVDNIPTVIAVTVVSIQLLVGVALLVNWNPLAALSAGAFLNLNFVLSGEVNPSVFFLVMAASIVSWHLDRNMGSVVKQHLVRTFVPGAIGANAVLAVDVKSIHPVDVIEDPASVLIFTIVLGSFITWSLQDLNGVDEREAIADTSLDPRR